MNKPETLAAIVAITQLFKQYGVPSRFCPIIALILGGIFGYSEKQNAQGIIDGVVMGALATGGYAVVKGSGQGILKSKSPTTSSLEHDDYRGV